MDTIRYDLMERFIEIPWNKKKEFKGYEFVPRNMWMETINIGDKIRLIDIKTGNFKKGGVVVEIGNGWNWVNVLQFNRREPTTYSALYYAIWYKKVIRKEEKLNEVIKMVVKKIDEDGETVD